MEIVAEFVIVDAQTHLVGFIHHRLLGDHALRGALHQVRHELFGDVALELLSAHQASLLRDLGHADLLIADFGQNALGGESAAEIVTEQAAGNEGDDHHHAHNHQNAAEQKFLEGSRLLQKTNHAVETPDV